MLLVPGHQLNKILVEQLFYMIPLLTRCHLSLRWANKLAHQSFVRLYLLLDEFIFEPQFVYLFRLSPGKFNLRFKLEISKQLVFFCID